MRIILVGHSASGKDYARTKLQAFGFNYCVSYTTRPKRQNEVDGVDYFFLPKEKFEQMIENKEFYEYVIFNDWYYGTLKSQFYNCNLFIMTPFGVSLIDKTDRSESLIIFFNIDEKIRLSRLNKRNDNNDSIKRRLKADEKDFLNYRDWDMEIKDPLFDIEEFIPLIFDKLNEEKNK